MTSGGERDKTQRTIKLSHHLCALYESISNPILSMRVEMFVLWRVLEVLCSAFSAQQGSPGSSGSP